MFMSPSVIDSTDLDEATVESETVAEYVDMTSDDVQADTENTTHIIDDDPVVHELDVYITKCLGKLVLTQYPLRPTYKPYQNVTRENMRMRPVQHQLEVDMKLQNKPNTPQQVQKLVVSQGALIKPNMAIGLVKGHELHLTPLESILQLTPSFEHIDKRIAEDAKLNEKPEETPTAQSVTRKFSKVETERDKALRLESYENLQQERQKEMWVPCDYRPPEHPYTAGQKRAMISKKGTKGISGCEISKDKYLDMLLPDCDEAEYTGPPHPDVVVGLSELQKLPHSKQVETVLRNAKVISFKNICDILKHVAKSTILSELQNIACLVQGHWVISSTVLHPKSTSSRLTGAPAELMCRHRDLILWAFAQKRTIRRENVMSISKIHPVEIEDIFKQVSNLTPREGWTFKIPYSSDFEDEYPEVASSQSAMWKKIFDELFVTLHLKNHKKNPLLELQKKTHVRELPFLTAEAAAKIIYFLDMADVVEPNTLVDLSLEFQTMIGLTTTPVDHLIDHMTQYIPHDQCSTVLGEMCHHLGLSIFNILTQDSGKVAILAYNKVGESTDRFRPAMFKLFQTKYLVSKAEIKEAIQQDLSCTMTNKDYQNITSALCEPGSARPGVWKLKISVAFKVVDSEP